MDRQLSAIRSLASVIIYKIYRFREAEHRAGEKRKNKIYEISLACEQETLTGIARNWPGINRKLFFYFNSNYQQFNSNYQQLFFLNVNVRECPWIVINVFE